MMSLDQNTLIVRDNFAANPDEIRAKALALSYDPQEFNGHLYSGVGLGYVPPVQQEVERLAGFQILKLRLSFFRLGATNGVDQGATGGDRRAELNLSKVTQDR